MALAAWVLQSAVDSFARAFVLNLGAAKARHFRGYMSGCRHDMEGGMGWEHMMQVVRTWPDNKDRISEFFFCTFRNRSSVEPWMAAEAGCSARG